MDEAFRQGNRAITSSFDFRVEFATNSRSGPKQEHKVEGALNFGPNIKLLKKKGTALAYLFSFCDKLNSSFHMQQLYPP